MVAVLEKMVMSNVRWRLTLAMLIDGEIKVYTHPYGDEKPPEEWVEGQKKWCEYVYGRNAEKFEFTSCTIDTYVLNK
jgi:hypothetical protein